MVKESQLVRLGARQSAVAAIPVSYPRERLSLQGGCERFAQQLAHKPEPRVRHFTPQEKVAMVERRLLEGIPSRSGRFH